MDFKNKEAKQPIRTSIHSSADTASSKLLQTSVYYTGLPVRQSLGPSKFVSYAHDPLYHFPVLSSSSRPVVPLDHFTQASLIDTGASLAALHAKSPFKILSEILPDQSSESLNFNSFSVDRPVFNICEELDKEKEFHRDTDKGSLCQSFQSSSVSFRGQSPEKANISFNTKELIMQLHRDFTCNRPDEKHLQSLTPRSSFSGDSVGSYPDLALEEEDSLSMFKNVEGQSRPSAVLFNDEESLPEEGHIRQSISTRIFLNGITASKSKLLTFSMTRAEVPDMYSPILRKLVVCQDEKAEPVTLTYVMASSGFQSVPMIEFSSQERRSKAFVQYSEQETPIVSLLSSKNLQILKENLVSWVSCGFEHCVALTIEGKVFSWGLGNSGCLGHGDTKNKHTPTLINNLFEEDIIYLECGGYHTAAVSKKGEIWTWGRGDLNQLGVEDLVEDHWGHVSLVPVVCRNLQPAKSVACGEAHTLVLDREGKVWTFGWAEDLAHQIRLVNIPDVVTKVGAGALFSACLTQNGQLYVWGNGEQGQLGLGNKILSISVPMVAKEEVVDFVCGHSLVLCLNAHGKTFGWGRGIAGAMSDTHLFPPGSAIVCYSPRELSEVDMVHRYLIKKQ